MGNEIRSFRRLGLIYLTLLFAVFSRSTVYAIEPADSLDSFTAGKDSSGTSSKKREILVLEEKVVRGYKTVLDESLTGKTVFASDVKKLPLIDNDVFRAVQAHPGVSSDEFSARFSVRGGDRDETLVIMDGMELFSPFHLQDYGGALSVVDLLAITRARLYLGGHPSEFGDRMSAVLDVKTREPSEKFSGDAGIDLLNAHVFISRKPVLAAIRAGWIGSLMTLMDSDEDFAPHYADALIRIDNSPSPNDKASSYLLYAGDLNTMDKPGKDDDVNSGFNNAMLWTRYTRQISEGLSLDIFPYGGLYIQERALGPRDRDDRNLYYSGLKTGLNMDYSRSASFKTGLEYKWMKGDYNFVNSDSGIFIDTRHTGATLKSFISHAWRINKYVSSETGGRVLYHTETARLDIGPQAAVTFSLFQDLSFRAAWGIYFQPVDALHIPVETGVSHTMKSERSMHWVGGVQYSSAPMGLNSRVEIYHKDYEDLTGYIRDFGRKSRFYLPHDHGFSRGIECLADKSLGLSHAHFGYSYSVSVIESGLKEYYSEDDSRHAFSAGLSADIKDKWSIYTGFIFNTGKPYTPLWYENNVRQTGRYNSKRLPPYHSLSVRIGREWKKQNYVLQTYLQVLNLYNRANVHEYSFTEVIRNGNTTFEKHEENLMPIIPSIGINASF